MLMNLSLIAGTSHLGRASGIWAFALDTFRWTHWMAAHHGCAERPL
jgi:hypothetical protein